MFEPGIPGKKWVPRVDQDEIPPGYGEVKVKLVDNGDEFNCVMVSGSVAYEVKGKKRDTLSPRTGWWMFTSGWQEPSTEYRMCLTS